VLGKPNPRQRQPKPLATLPDHTLDQRIRGIQKIAHQSAKTGQVLAEQMREGLETFSEEVD
jgi:hypothetical protein